VRISVAMSSPARGIDERERGGDEEE